VPPVLKLPTIVSLVTLTEITHHHVHVIMVISKLPQKSVKNVQFNVLLVHPPLFVKNVLVTENIFHIVIVQPVPMIMVKKPVHLVITNVTLVKDLPPIVPLVTISELHQANVHVQVDIMKIKKI